MSYRPSFQILPRLLRPKQEPLLNLGDGCGERGGAQRGLPAKLKMSELRLVCARSA